MSCAHAQVTSAHRRNFWFSHSQRLQWKACGGRQSVNNAWITISNTGGKEAGRHLTHVEEELTCRFPLCEQKHQVFNILLFSTFHGSDSFVARSSCSAAVTGSKREGAKVSGESLFPSIKLWVGSVRGIWFVLMDCCWFWVSCCSRINFVSSSGKDR